MKLTLTVTCTKHPNAATKDDPSKGKRQIGFSVIAVLEQENLPAYSNLQDRYKLQQFVKDTYWFQVRESEDSTEWEDTAVSGPGPWELDKFGTEDTVQGSWSGDSKKTVFEDEPGFLGVGAGDGRALTSLQRLGDYKVWFYWTVTNVANGNVYSTEHEPIALHADPEDDGSISYKGLIVKTWKFEL